MKTPQQMPELAAMDSYVLKNRVRNAVWWRQVTLHVMHYTLFFLNIVLLVNSLYTSLPLLFKTVAATATALHVAFVVAYYLLQLDLYKDLLTRTEATSTMARVLEEHNSFPDAQQHMRFIAKMQYQRMGSELTHGDPVLTTRGLYNEMLLQQRQPAGEENCSYESLPDLLERRRN